MRILVPAAVVLALTFTAANVRAAEGAPAPKVATEASWYADQMAAVYIGSLGLVAWNAATDVRYPALTLSAGLSIGLAPPVLHVAHGNYLTAAKSLAVRGLFLLTAATVGARCIDLSGDTSVGCSLGAALLAAEMVAIPVVDFALSRKTVERSSPSTGVSLSMLPPSGQRPGLLALAGRF